MVEQSRLEGLGARFGTYVEDLREFFTSRSVRFGSPREVQAFAERVGAPGAFQDEMGSMVRSIFFSESESLGRRELVELVLVAVGGMALEPSAAELQPAVRKIVGFVNAAFHQDHGMGPGGPDAETEQEVTAGDILAVPPLQSEREEGVVGGRSPDDGSLDITAPEGGKPPEGDFGRGVPVSGGGVLYRAVPVADDDSARYDEVYVRQPRANRWLVPAVVAGVIAVGLGGYAIKTLTVHPSAATESATSGVATTQQRAGLLAGTCVNAPTPGISRANLQERARWARNLLDQKLYEAALPEIREVARLDPGYPGINLDESDALMQLKRPEDARDAVDTQITISECLAKLPSAALDAYCSTEFSSSTVGGCRPQLAHIRQAAELQAALVHLELGHRAAPDSGAIEATAAAADRTAAASVRQPRPVLTPAPRPRHSIVLPPATEGDTAQPVLAPRTVASSKAPAAKKPAHKERGDESLIHGEGTDSAFGAYSKPQE